MMDYIRKLDIGVNVFIPRYLTIHTNGFRRVSSEVISIEDSDYNLWEFTSNKIPFGAALIPTFKAEYILIFSLDKTESIYDVPHKFDYYLRVYKKTIDSLVPRQNLYVKMDDWG